VATAIKKLTVWAAERGLNVRFANVAAVDSEYCPESRTITISNRVGLRSQTYLLAHECGHALINQQGTQYADGRLGRVEEELAAWHRGRRLTARLKIRVDRKAYARLRARMLKSYLRWCVDAG
jgi:hypothetical protein